MPLSHPLGGSVGLDFGLGGEVAVAGCGGEVDPRSYKAFLCSWDLVRTACQSLVREGPKWRVVGGERAKIVKSETARVMMLVAVLETMEFRNTECVPMPFSLLGRIPTSSQPHRWDGRMGVERGPRSRNMPSQTAGFS